MLIGAVEQKSLVSSPRRETDWLGRFVRVGLFLLVSPALILVLAVGGLLLVWQYTSQGSRKLLGLIHFEQPMHFCYRSETLALSKLKKKTSTTKKSGSVRVPREHPVRL